MAYNDNLNLIRQMLDISGSLDIETVGLRSGAGTHEIAYGIFGKGAAPGDVSQYIVEPHTVLNIGPDGKVQPYVRGEGSPFVYRPGNWQAVDAVNLMLKEGAPGGEVLTEKNLTQMAQQFIDERPGEEFVEALRKHNAFRANTYGSLGKTDKFPYLPRVNESGEKILPGQTFEDINPRVVQANVERVAKDFKIPIGTVRTEKLATDQLLSSSSGLSRQLRDNITWIANAQFESRQLGANLEVLEKTLIEQKIADGIDEATAIKQAHSETFRNSLAWQNPRQTGLLYTTGSEYNKARAAALTGSSAGGWIDVWKALLNNTKAGDVRDIFDVMKAQEAYVRKIAPGLLPEQSVVTGGIDVQHRLMKALEQGSSGLLITEPHVGALDVPIQEYMVKRLLPETAALQAVAEGTEEGLELLAQARSGKGIVSDVLRRYSMTAALMPDQQRANILKRLDEATVDLATKQVSDQFVRHKVVSVEQLNKAGEQALVDVAIPETKGFQSLDAIVDLMSQSQHYPEEMLREEVAAYQAKMQGYTGDDLIAASRAYVDERTLGLTSPGAKEASFGRLAGVEGTVEEGAEAFFKQHGRMPDTPLFSARRAATQPLPVSGVGRIGLGIGAAMATMGVMHAVANGGRPAEPPPSMISQNYQQWLDTQNQFYGTRGSGSYMNGMSHTGVAGGRRSSMTDFGSPYQGPMAASYVFMQQDLLAEREAYMRQQFADIHTGWGEKGKFGVFSPYTKHSYSGKIKHTFLQAGESAAGMSLPGIRGDEGIKVLDLANYKIQVDDADTITVKRGGIRGAISSFFGFNRGYEFRLAGIDAPETFHGELGMKSAQPHADDATLALKAMLRESGSLQLVFDPENITYGRMVGAVIADGRNVNFDLVKRGHVAALPFYKKGVDPLVDLESVQTLESFSRSGQTGMWSNPYFQVYSDVVNITDQRITFNTFSRINTVAQNATTMSLASLMQNAQDQGFVGTADRIAAAQIGERYKEFGYQSDYSTKIITPTAAAPHTSYLQEMAMDNARFMKTRGSVESNMLAHRGGYGNLDKKLAIDSVGTTNSIWNKRKLATYETYGVENERRRRRREEMALSQRHALKNMFQTPIGHHRM